MQNSAGLNDARVNDAIENIEAFAAGLDETVVTQKSEMLGKVGLGQASDFEKLGHTKLFVLDIIEDFQATLVGEKFINMRVSLKGFFW